MATATLYTQELGLEQLYVAYFGRSADPVGFSFFLNGLTSGGDSLANIANEFANSPESKALYPFLGVSPSNPLTPSAATAFIAQVYQNLFNRTPEAAGAAYWASVLTSSNAGDVINGIANGAQGSDINVLLGKDQAALNYTTSVTAATYNNGDSVAAVVGGFTLTTSTDIATANVFNGGLQWSPGGDVFVNTLQNTDQLTGRGSNPTLNVTLGSYDWTTVGGAAYSVQPTLNGIQTVNATFNGSASTAITTFDLQNSTGVQTFNVLGITDPQSNVSVINFTSVPTNLSVANTSSPAGSVTFATLDTAASGAADATTLKVSNVKIGTLNLNAGSGNGIEFVTLVTTGSGANTLGSFNDSDITKLTITGAQNLKIGSIGYNDQGKFTTIDGSAATGNLNLTLDSLQLAAIATNFATTGGDVAFTLTTGSGNDTINSSIDFGNASHTRAAGNINDVVDGGTGKDTLAFHQSVTTSFSDHATYNNFEAVTVTRDDSGTAAPVTLTVDSANITGDQSFFLVNQQDTVPSVTTFNLQNLSAAEATQITIAHSGLNAQSSGNDGLANNFINVGTTASTVGVTVVNGTNSDPRFNFHLNAAGVANITLTDSDTESNTVQLDSFGAHTGTITLTGGVARQFLNLDASANGYGLDTTGGSNDLAGIVANAGHTDAAVSAVYTNTNDYRTSFLTAAGGELLSAANIIATGETSDVILRVSGSIAANPSNGGQDILLGSGNDTVVFADRTDINLGTSGLTIADTVVGGAGQDTIVLDGSGPQFLRASEWTNLSGIDVIRLAGVDGAHTTIGGIAPTYTVGSGSSTITGAASLSTVDTATHFNLIVTNQLVGQTDNGSRLTILNNDGDLHNNSENASTIDLRELDGSHFVTFVGPNGDGTRQAVQATQIVQLSDVSANSGQHLNGGDPNINLASGNSNILQIFNNATVTVGDLVNTKNFQTVQFWNDTTTAQTLSLTIDNATFTALADSTKLYVQAVDSTTVTGAYAELNLQAGGVTGTRNFVVYGSQGADVINTGAGNDVILAYSPFSINANQGGDHINAGGGTDSVYLNNTSWGFGTTHVNADTVTVNTAGEAVYIYGLQTGDNVNISADSYVWTEPSTPGGHGITNFNISGGNVQLVNAYDDDIYVTGGTTVLSTTGAGTNNNNHVYITSGISSIDLATHNTDDVHISGADTQTTVLSSYNDTLTITGGSTTLGIGWTGHAIGSDTINLSGTGTFIDLGSVHTQGFDTLNVTSGAITVQDLHTSDLLNITGDIPADPTSVTLVSSTSAHISILANTGSVLLDLGTHTTGDTIALGYNTTTVVTNAHVNPTTGIDTFMFGTTATPGLLGIATTETQVTGTTGMHISTDGVITFDGTPTDPIAARANEILYVLETSTFGIFNAHDKLAFYNDGVNTWLFDAHTATQGTIVELVGVTGVTGFHTVTAGFHQVQVA